MKVYFLRRLLLIPLTMFGVTFLVFSITRVMPGSPIERQMQEASQATLDGGSSAGGGGAGGLSEEQLEELEREYLYDKSIPVAYMMWGGLLPRERRHSQAEFRKGGEDRVGEALVTDYETEVLVTVSGTGRQAKVVREGEKVISAHYTDDESDLLADGWRVRIELPAERQEAWLRRHENKTLEDAPSNYDARAVVFKARFSGVLQGDLGRSSEFGDPVLDLIWERLPIAAYFGILTAIISYGICLPLGIVKAIKHRTLLDNLSSVLIFVGYAIPGFALGAILVIYLGARWHVFPIMGLTSSDSSTMTSWEQVKDLAAHTVLPLSCYIVGSFAWLTMMMKNNLMDNLAADYVRTAVAKGVGFNRAVYRHAFRNSFIPIAASLGSIITIFVGGSILIETIFDIEGFGLLQFRALLGSDVNVIMGTLVISSFLMLLGNVLSDFIVAFVDPRVKFS